MPSYRAKVTGPDGKRYTSPRFRELAAARNWQTDTLARMNSGTFIAPTTVTMRMAAEEFIEGAKGGAVLTRKGVPYRPSAIRDYAGDLHRHVLPALGDMRLSDVRRGDVQRLVDALVAQRLAPSTIRNALDPLRRIFDRAAKRGLVPFSPCQHLEVPRGTRTRDRVASPEEARSLLAALPETDKRYSQNPRLSADSLVEGARPRESQCPSASRFRRPEPGGQALRRVRTGG